jgi:hypothetical protein
MILGLGYTEPFGVPTTSQGFDAKELGASIFG